MLPGCPGPPVHGPYRVRPPPTPYAKPRQTFFWTIENPKWKMDAPNQKVVLRKQQREERKGGAGMTPWSLTIPTRRAVLRIMVGSVVVPLALATLTASATEGHTSANKEALGWKPHLIRKGDGKGGWIDHDGSIQFI